MRADKRPNWAALGKGKGNHVYNENNQANRGSRSIVVCCVCSDVDRSQCGA
jgi:hypothetical protein